MTLRAALLASFRFRLVAFLATAWLAAAGSLLAEDRPFRTWDPPAPQGIECRLAYWTAGNAVFLETEARDYVILAKGLLSSADKAYVLREMGDQPATPIAPELLRDPMPYFKPDGSYYAPEIPFGFNGRCVLNVSADGKIVHLVNRVRDFAPRTQIELIERFGKALSPEELIYATAPFREAIWIANEKRSLAQIVPGIRGDFALYPADTYLVAVDGARYFFETRLEGESKDAAQYPKFLSATWSDDGRQDWDPLVRFINLGYGRHATLSPTSQIPHVQQTLRDAGRGETGPLGEPRLWKQTQMQAPTGPMKGRIIVRNARQALVLREDGVVDIVEYPTAEDAEYLIGLDGFWTAGHDPSTPVKYEAVQPPAFSRDLVALFRDYEKDESLIADLEAGLNPPPGTAPRDVSDFRYERLKRLSGLLLSADEQYVATEVERLREGVRTEKLTMGAANKRLTELQKRRVDPTDGNTPAEKLIADWKRLRPQSPNPSLVEAMACYSRAWALRGQGFVGEVNEKEAEGFGLFIDKCEGALDEADDAAANDPIGLCVRLSLGRSAGYPRDKMDALAARVEAADPNFSRPHGEMAMYLQQRWHGAPGDTGKYVAGVVKRHRGQFAVDVFYQVYTTLFPTDVDLLEHGMFDRETLAAVAEDMTAVSEPGEELWNYAEVFAYFSHDPRVAKKMIAKAGGLDKFSFNRPGSDSFFPNEESAEGAERFFEEANDAQDLPNEDLSLWKLELPGANFAAASMETALLNEGAKALIVADPAKATIVDLRTKEIAGSFSIPGLSLKRIHGSSDGKTLVLTGTDAQGDYAIFRVGAGSGGKPTRLQGVEHREPISPEVLSADGRYFAKSVRSADPSGPTKFTVWDATTGKKIAEEGLPGPIDHPFFSSEGDFLSWNSRAVDVYDLATKKLSRQERDSLQAVLDPQYVPTGEVAYFVVDKRPKESSRDHFQNEAARTRLAIAKSLDDPNPKLAPFPMGWRPMQAYGRFVVGPGCRRIFVVVGKVPTAYASALDPSAIDSSTIEVFDVATGERTHRLRGHGGTIKSLLYRNDDTLVSTATDGTLRLWDVSDKGLAELANAQGDVTLPTKQTPVGTN